jgi:AmmeMemoRadiSam system protein A
MFEEDTWRMEVDFTFTPEEKAQLLRIARKSLTAVVSGKPYSPAEVVEPKLRQKAGAFVTLHLHGELRGCIGLIEAYLPLCETVAEMAAKAAVADPRFESVTKSEVDEIEIEISVLSPLKKIADPDEVVVGRHGLIIEKGYYRGLLLPQVATENGWDREQFLRYVCVKAGLGREDYKDPASKLSVFTAEVFSEGETRKEQEEDIAERA